MSFDRIYDRISDRIEIEKRKKQTKKKRFTMETKGKIFSIGKNEYSYRGLNLKFCPISCKFYVSPQNWKMKVKPFELERKNVIDVCHYIDLFVL